MKSCNILKDFVLLGKVCVPGQGEHILLFELINQPDATVLQVYYLTSMCRSTCFGRLHAHHQELITALTASGFTLERWR